MDVPPGSIRTVMPMQFCVSGCQAICCNQRMRRLQFIMASHCLYSIVVMTHELSYPRCLRKRARLARCHAQQAFRMHALGDSPDLWRPNMSRFA